MTTIQHMTTILLLCGEGCSRLAYQSEIGATGVHLICVPGLLDFFVYETYTPLNGIMVDMPTYIRSSDEDKRLLSELVDLFPSLRLKCHEPTGEIRSLPFGKNFQAAGTLSDFILNCCSTFTSRNIRTCERSGIHLPTLVSRFPTVEVNGSFKAVTANISLGGCFLINFEIMNVSERAWLKIPGLLDPTPIQVEVCWVRPWGERHSLPGMGVKFLQVTRDQKTELARLGGRCLMFV